MNQPEKKNNEKKQFGQNIGPAIRKTARVMGIVCDWVFKLRKLILAIPVLVGMIWLAVRNSRILPDEVPVIVLKDGIAEQMIPRNVAVFGPVAVTMLCLLLMMCSRKTLYPWLISIFSLILPLMFMLSGVLPM